MPASTVKFGLVRVTHRPLPDRAKRRNTFKITEFVECGLPMPSMFEPSDAIVVRIDWPRIADLAHFFF